MRFGMVIDIRKCIGCKACAIVCKQSNQIPFESWRRVVDCGVSDAPDRMRVFFPMSCMHCSEPPCLDVCPTKATYQRSDGIVDIDKKLCIGCAYCIVACPYHARRIIYHNKEDFKVKIIEHELEVDDMKKDSIGICTKCNFCQQRIDSGLSREQRPGIDPDATPMCVVSCSAGALHFGDLDDAESAVSQLIRDNKTVCLNEEVGTHPSLYYIVE